MKGNTLRGMRDLRSMRDMRSTVRRSGQAESSGTYVDMLRLSTEKARLERELAMWQAHVQRSQARLADIAAQMQELEAIAARERKHSDSQEDAVEELTLTY